jgi:hypothetical protein
MEMIDCGKDKKVRLDYVSNQGVGDEPSHGFHGKRAGLKMLNIFPEINDFLALLLGSHPFTLFHLTASFEKAAFSDHKGRSRDVSFKLTGGMNLDF